MTRQELGSLFRDLQGFSLNEWENLFDFVQAWKPARCLDLGFGHGVSTVCMAKALEEIGLAPSILALDEMQARYRVPNLDDLLERAALFQADVSIGYEESSANWAFIGLLEARDAHRFDLVHLGGSKSWYAMGLSVFAAQQLLLPGGWLVLSGADYAYASSWDRYQDWVRRMPISEQLTQQVNKVFELLVLPNPEFTEFRRSGNRYFARKKQINDREPEQKPFAIQLAEILFRATRDPDFRFDLLWHPERVVASLPGAKAGLHFRDEAPARSLGQEYDPARNCFFLRPPIWESDLGRGDLQAMIDAAF